MNFFLIIKLSFAGRSRALRCSVGRLLSWSDTLARSICTAFLLFSSFSFAYSLDADVFCVVFLAISIVEEELFAFFDILNFFICNFRQKKVLELTLFAKIPMR